MPVERGRLTYYRATELMEAAVNNDIVALDPVAGQCFGFNEVAAEVWRHLREPRSFGSLKGHLLSQFDVTEKQCESDLRDLLDDLLGKGLVEQR